MVNLAVPYRNPVPAAATMWREVQAAWPDCAENKGFVAGSGPTTWNISSHNADADGYAHALDIGVDIEGDGTGIPIQAGIDLSEHLRQLGYKEWKSGRAGRLAYIIHRGQIAGDHTGWQWVKYTGASPHYDHIHISFSYDYFWGDPIWETSSDVYSTAPWGIATIVSGQGSDITPITEEGFLMALPDQDQVEVLENVRKLVALATVEAGFDKGMNEKLDEVVGNLRKTYWNTAEAKILLKSAAPADLAAQIDAAGIAAEVRDELVKLLGGGA
ncbi:hypothetical protein [Arthrobacter sp. HLT1-20]